MILQHKVMASRLTNLTDARYFAAWYVDYLGVNLEAGNADSVDSMTFMAMKEWVEGPEWVAELGFVEGNVESVVSALAEWGIKNVQVGSFSSNDVIKNLSEAGLSVILEVSASSEDNHFISPSMVQKMESLKSGVKCFRWDLSSISLEVLFEQTKEIKNICSMHPIWLDLPYMEGERLLSFLNDVQPMGLAVKGGPEEKVGFKSYDELDDVFEALEID